VCSYPLLLFPTGVVCNLFPNSSTVSAGVLPEPHWHSDIIPSPMYPVFRPPLNPNHIVLPDFLMPDSQRATRNLVWHWAWLDLNCIQLSCTRCEAVRLHDITDVLFNTTISRFILVGIFDFFTWERVRVQYVATSCVAPFLNFCGEALALSTDIFCVILIHFNDYVWRCTDYPQKLVSMT